jgi:hypothetical protein
MSARTDEQAARARLRALAKARRVRARNVDRRRAHIDRDRGRFAVWVKREHAAYDRHAAAPADANLRRVASRARAAASAVRKARRGVVIDQAGARARADVCERETSTAPRTNNRSINNQISEVLLETACRQASTDSTQTGGISADARRTGSRRSHSHAHPAGALTDRRAAIAVNVEREEPMQAVTNEDLQAAKLEVRRTRPPYDEALRARRELVKRALKQGMRPAHVARHVGLTRSAVGKMR